MTTVPIETPPTVPGDSVGASWEDATGNLAGLESECGNLSYVSARPDRRGLIAGVALQGLWSSEDGGETWEQLGDAEGSDEVTHRLTDVQYDPENPTKFWISGLYNAGGVYQTPDDGRTFLQLGRLSSVEDVGVDFSDPRRQTLVAPLHDLVSIWRSRDGGETWDDISEGLPPEGGNVAAVEVFDADTYVAGIRQSAVPGIFRTVDGGATWERVDTHAVVGQPVWLDDELVWLIERGRGVVVSDDEGETWTEVPSSSISPFATSLTTLPDGRLVTVSDRTLIASSDRGVTWRPLGPGLPYEPNGVVYSTHDDAFLIWRWDCTFGQANPVRSSSIMRLQFAPGPT